MGHMKDRIIQQDEQGWKFRDDLFLCFRCVSDPYLKQMIKEQADEIECSFCGRMSRKVPTCISFNDFMEVYARAIFRYFDHAENEAIAWDPEDQKYVGTTYDTWDLVRDEFAPTHRENVFNAIIDSLGHHTWCEQSPYSLSHFDQYRYGWEAFCETVKHKYRYFFNSIENTDEHSETIAVPEMLDELGDLVQQYGLVDLLPIDTPLFRVRVHDPSEICNNWQSLGSPPPENCLSNRMSAAGISVFYAAMDIATAKAESFVNLKGSDKRILTGAMWKCTRELCVLDFTKLPPIPSIYSDYGRFERDRLIFLHHFVENITQPVIHDGREHIDYIPTQILIEYFRYRFRLSDNT